MKLINVICLVCVTVCVTKKSQFLPEIGVYKKHSDAVLVSGEEKVMNQL